MSHVDDRRLLAPPIAALYDYHERVLQRGSRRERTHITSEAAKATRLLSSVERATARITLGPPSHGVGPMHEAVARLRVFEARGLLTRMSVHAVAQNLQSVLFSGHPLGMRYAAKGWLLLDCCDRFDLLQVTLSTPDPDDPRRFRRLRLHERITEIRENANVRNRNMSGNKTLPTRTMPYRVN